MEIWHIGSLTSLKKAKQIWPQIAWLCRKNSRALGGLGGPQTPGLLYSSAFGRARPTARHYFQIFSSRPGLIPVSSFPKLCRSAKHVMSNFIVRFVSFI